MAPEDEDRPPDGTLILVRTAPAMVFVMLTAIGAGGYGGWRLDTHYEAGGYLLLVGLFAGVAVGFLWSYLSLRRAFHAALKPPTKDDTDA